MKAYRLNYDTPDLDNEYYRTRVEAHRTAKHVTNPELEAALRIEQIEVRTDKDSILNYLNDGDKVNNFAVLKTWALKESGALREVPNGE